MFYTLYAAEPTAPSTQAMRDTTHLTNVHPSLGANFCGFVTQLKERGEDCVLNACMRCDRECCQFTWAPKIFPNWFYALLGIE